jgi:hypothetical protein
MAFHHVYSVDTNISNDEDWKVECQLCPDYDFSMPHVNYCRHTKFQSDIEFMSEKQRRSVSIDRQYSIDR